MVVSGSARPGQQSPATADEYRVSDFSTSRITQTGNAAAMDADCGTCRLSTRSRRAATTLIDTAHTTRKRRGGWS